MDVKDAVVVITGGASGLGEACVWDLIEKGARVSILDIDEERGEEITKEHKNAAIFCKTDVTNEKSVLAAINKTINSFGSIQAAVNCAGAGIPRKVVGKKGLMPMDYFSGIVQLNLMGSMNVIRLAGERMLKNAPNQDGEKGVIINTASIAAFDGQIGQAAYSASKAGVVGMMLPIAREFADYGIRVVTIAPGLFDTPAFSAQLSEKVKQKLVASVPFPKRLGKPSEFAKLVRHIVENPMLNGITIRLDGALRMSAK